LVISEAVPLARGAGANDCYCESAETSCSVLDSRLNMGEVLARLVRVGGVGVIVAFGGVVSLRLRTTSVTVLVLKTMY
jgi:hypothetical protein